LLIYILSSKARTRFLLQCYQRNFLLKEVVRQGCPLSPIKRSCSSRLSIISNHIQIYFINDTLKKKKKKITVKKYGVSFERKKKKKSIVMDSLLMMLLSHDSRVQKKFLRKIIKKKNKIK